MFIKKPVSKTGLDEAIESALRELNGYEAASAEYAQVVDQLAKLNTMKDAQKSDRVSKDTVVLVLGNLAGIVMIVGHERAHIVTSKALSLIRAVK